MKNKEVINIALASDQRYFTGLVGTLISMLVNANKSYFYQIFVIDGGVDTLSKNALISVIDRIRLDIEVSFIQVDLENYKDQFPSFYFDSVMPYARLLIPEVLNTIDKIIYLDSDILFLKDIASLWNLSLEDNSAAACSEVVMPHLMDDSTFNGLDSFDMNSPYFNSGLLVMDLKRMRSNQITSKSIKLLVEGKNRFKWHDQSVLNYLLYNDFLLLDQSWNTQSHRAVFRIEEGLRDFLSYQLNYHFVTKFKPWIIYNEELPNLFFRALLDCIGWKYETAPFLLSKKKFEREQKIASLFPIWLQTKNTFYRLIGNKDLSDKLNKLTEIWKDRNAMYSFLESKRNEVETGLVSWEQKVKSLFN